MTLFSDNKDIHVKISKEAYIFLRTLMFKKGLSMQEVFSEFADLIYMEDRSAHRIVDNLVVKKAEGKLAEIKKQRKMSELDQDTLYSLLEDQSPLAKQEKEDE